MVANSLFVVEYSANQDCFHVDALDRVLLLNQRNALHKKSSDYQIIAICNSIDIANTVCNTFRNQQAVA